ncbi:MAG: uncharacterized protein A8A55_1931 [Amphiamblys sp. WSBS2006]|nr:MAG: uncharacterized protein A8A55_1931 [Amphiamblys sp. WSBS2006]
MAKEGDETFGERSQIESLFKEALVCLEEGDENTLNMFRHIVNACSSLFSQEKEEDVLMCVIYGESLYYLSFLEEENNEEYLDSAATLYKNTANEQNMSVLGVFRERVNLKRKDKDTVAFSKSVAEVRKDPLPGYLGLYTLKTIISCFSGEEFEEKGRVGSICFKLLCEFIEWREDMDDETANIGAELCILFLTCAVDVEKGMEKIEEIVSCGVLERECVCVGDVLLRAEFFLEAGAVCDDEKERELYGKACRLIEKATVLDSARVPLDLLQFVNDCKKGRLSQ